jgi:hypothetical protein
MDSLINVPKKKGFGAFISDNFILILAVLFVVAVCIVLLVVLGGATEDTTFNYTIIMSQGLHGFCNSSVIVILVLVVGYLGLKMLSYLK